MTCGTGLGKSSTRTSTMATLTAVARQSQCKMQNYKSKMLGTLFLELLSLHF
jgi:hypothetical protein